MEGSNVVVSGDDGRRHTADLLPMVCGATNGVYVPMANSGTISGANTPSLTFTRSGWTNAADY